VLLYGSVFRDGLDVEDGLFDVLVVVDGYRAAYGGWTGPLSNRLLPPNVFYLECSLGEQTVRAKYAVVSRRQLDRYTSRTCLQSYFWGRLAQPVIVTWTRDQQVEQDIRSALDQATLTFAKAAASLMTGEFDAATLWERGLSASYRTEFRPESSSRARALTERDLEHYEAASRAAAEALGWSIREPDDDVLFTPPPRTLGHLRGRAAWWLRRVQGRTLHVLRLIKATRTFRGGVDYLLWKIERHSGVKMEVSDRVRRYPLIFGWGMLWRLRRKGGFR